jgi:hypothetical protein
VAQITITRLNDGPRNAIFHVVVVGDGSGDLVDATLIDPATSFEEPMPAQPALRIVGLHYDLSGFIGLLEYDYLMSDTPIWTMTPGAGGFDFTRFAGLTDRSLSDGSGKIMLSTYGLGVGDYGTVVIEAKKS